MTTIVKRMLFCRTNSLVRFILSGQRSSFQYVSRVCSVNQNLRFKHLGNPRVQLEHIPGSRYARPSRLEQAEEYIRSTLSDKVFLSDEEWDNFKTELLENESFDEENFSSVVMSVINSSNQLELSRNFLKYLEKCSVKPNFLTYLSYISLCGKNHKAVEQEELLKIIDKVKSPIDSSPVYDAKRLEYLVQGLCATDRWRDSFQYFDKLIDKKPTRNMCVYLACAAIRNRDETLAWQILTTWMNPYDFGHETVIEEFLLVALEMQKSSPFEADKFVERLFEFMQKRDVIVTVNVVKLIEQYFRCHRHKWTISYTKVKRKGTCDQCSHQLKCFLPTDREFRDLEQGFLKRAIMKSDVYINTTSREFNQFMDFIDIHKPFHVVIDGLNAAHTFQGYRNKKNLLNHLWNVVKTVSHKNRQILVLGRRHMKTWPSIQRISQRAKLFFTENISQDDPFVIYAALASGPHTLVLSGDLMRDHLSCLDDPRLMFLFKRWQKSHQIFIKSDENNLITLIEPVRHSITVQGNMKNGWHIPFDDKIILDAYEELNNWLCIRRYL